jgi:Reverse transcriptase (RNA-dependent DNA polymerase)
MVSIKLIWLRGGGHLTDIPLESVYSGVVSLRSVRLIAFILELNELKLWATDIGNVYLEAYTSEKVCFIAGGEFGEFAGHLIIIIKALYGLKSSGLHWHDCLATVLWEMEFFPCKANPDVWMREQNKHYEYIGVYVDDLKVTSEDPKSILDQLSNNHNFKLKGMGTISFYLGCGFIYDSDGVLCQTPSLLKR